METVEHFAKRAEQWVRANLEPAARNEGLEADDEARLKVVTHAREVQRRIFDAGLAGIRYPQEYGGLGLTHEHQQAWTRVSAAYNVPHSFNVTHGILGPTLLNFANEDVKRHHIPKMLSGEELWVQLLSEPNSGSDMAAVITTAQRSGDTYVLNGSKIWSSGAHHADYAMVLARTDADVPKHQGLSMFIMPLRHPGVTITPIRLATGGSHFCQEFLDDVVIVSRALIGEENDGWRVATDLLFHERNMVAGNSYNDHTLAASNASHDDDVVALARAVDRAADPVTRQLVGEALVLERLQPFTIARVNALMAAGKMPPAGAGVLKLMKSEAEYRLREICLAIGGTRAVMAGKNDAVGFEAHRWLGARIETLAGGSSEMQRNVISERVLSLPREPASDRDIPFRDVPTSQRAKR